MLKWIHLLRTLGFCVLFSLLSGTVLGQQQGGGAAADGAGGGGDGAPSPDEAFQNVERGNTVGSTASTGAGFSDASVTASQAAGGGGGGGPAGFGGSPFGGFGGFGGLGNLFGNQAFGNNNQSTPPVIRTRMRASINVSRPSTDQSQRTASTRLRAAPSSVQLGGVQVRMENQTAVLTGTTSTMRERRMSELLMRLEPGVRQVRNEIVVVSPNQ